MPKLENIYIISYFNDNSRRDLHEQQLIWTKENNLIPHVVPQGYTKQDYKRFSQYNPVYLDTGTDQILHPGPARNVALRHFYNSGDPWAIFADNDAALHKDSCWFLDVFRNLPDEIDAGLISFVNPHIYPNAVDLCREQGKQNLVFSPEKEFAGSFFVLRQLEDQIYFDPKWVNDDGSMRPLEDREFAMRLNFNGYPCYCCLNATYREFDGGANSTWASNDQERMRRYQEAEQFLTIPDVSNMLPSFILEINA